MSRSRPIVVFVLLLAVSSLTAWAQAAEPTNAELQAQIAALEKRLAQLERNIVAQFRNMEQRIAQGIKVVLHQAAPPNTSTALKWQVGDAWPT